MKVNTVLFCNILENLVSQIPGLIIGGYITFRLTLAKISAENKNNTSKEILNTIDQCEQNIEREIKERYLLKKNINEKDAHFKACQLQNILDHLDLASKKALRLSNEK